MELRKYKILEKKQDIESEATAFTRHLRYLDLQPFAGEDTSVGMEYELQVAVAGDPKPRAFSTCCAVPVGAGGPGTAVGARVKVEQHRSLAGGNGGQRGGGAQGEKATDGENR